jgi:uncharacterized protein (DUF433 family)
MDTSQQNQEGYFATDPRQRPLYTVAAASRLIGVPQPTIRSWVWGRAYLRADGKAEWPRIIEPPQDPAHRLSFWNLLELQALRALRAIHEVKIPLVREALEVSEKEYGIEHLLIHEDLRTLAGELFIERYGDLIHLGRGSRLVLGSLWAKLADRIDFGKDGLGMRLRPWLPNAPEIKTILLDPAVAFGRPTLKGIRVDVLHSRFEGGEDAQSIADDFDLHPDEVEQAIRFDQLAAA